MHPAINMAIAAQRGDELRADAAAARRARQVRRSRSAQPAQTTHQAWPALQVPARQARALPVRLARADLSGLTQAAMTKPFRSPRPAA